MLVDTKKTTTEFMLINWARWAYESRGVSINWPGIEPFAKMSPVRKQGMRSQITDDQAEVIDAGVSALRRAHRQQGDMLALYYLTKMTYRDIGRYKGVHHSTVGRKVDAGREWIREWLDENGA